MMQPEIAKPKPATIAAITRGIRMFQTISEAVAVPELNKALIASTKVKLLDPTKIESIERIITNINKKIKVITFFLIDILYFSNTSDA